MKVELERGVWVVCGTEDSPTTLSEENAKDFNDLSDALRAIEEARKVKPYQDAVVQDDFV